MSEEFYKRHSRSLAGCVASLMMLPGLAGCYKKSGEAVVLEKEHIAMREPTPTPAGEPSVSPSPTVASSDESETTKEIVRELRDDEVSIDGYVMKKDVRGTGKDPRAMDQERWIVRVQMVADLRRVDVQTDQSRWEKLKVGDRVRISYRQGKFTGTVWASEIE